jgi:hypothetical protein
MAGALVLAFRLPTLPAKWAALRGPLVAMGIITSFALMAGTWVGAAPHLHRLPVQLAIAGFAWLAIWGLGRLRVPRWGFTAGMVVITILFVVMGAYFFALIAGIGALVFFAGRVIGWLAFHSGLPRDEEIATAIIIGYAFGQLMPMPF